MLATQYPHPKTKLVVDRGAQRMTVTIECGSAPISINS